MAANTNPQLNDWITALQERLEDVHEVNDELACGLRQEKCAVKILLHWLEICQTPHFKVYIDKKLIQKKNRKLKRDFIEANNKITSLVEKLRENYETTEKLEHNQDENERKLARLEKRLARYGAGYDELSEGNRKLKWELRKFCNWKLHAAEENLRLATEHERLLKRDFQLCLDVHKFEEEKRLYLKATGSHEPKCVCRHSNATSTPPSYNLHPPHSASTPPPINHASRDTVDVPTPTPTVQDGGCYSNIGGDRKRKRGKDSVTEADDPQRRSKKGRVHGKSPNKSRRAPLVISATAISLQERHLGLTTPTTGSNPTTEISTYGSTSTTPNANVATTQEGGGLWQLGGEWGPEGVS
ncbi:MAG: hypothetical protein MMC33_000655 [Icmadophila ericetorum]|nr:hypothetical protein [Icmadophila ericetorum]